MPFLIGGSGERRTLRIVARDADLWNGEGDPATYARKNAILDGHCAEIGRDPSEIRRTVGVPPICIRDNRAGAVARLAEILGAQGGTPADARAWAESSPLADTEAVVTGLLRAWRDAGAEGGDRGSGPMMRPRRLAGPVRDRLGWTATLERPGDLR
jgi:alkanesulfonate monooxygenase SsuD/methylene tetrahydromethanopterin reductase-like flavin-dependent oxidoreductase (luciferase family)